MSVLSPFHFTSSLTENEIRKRSAAPNFVRPSVRSPFRTSFIPPFHSLIRHFVCLFIYLFIYLNLVAYSMKINDEVSKGFTSTRLKSKTTDSNYNDF